jgi:hypothetical protein
MRVLIFLVVLMLGTGAHAGDDITAAQSIIRAQEEAFRRDDAAAAYAYAAPGIQAYFRNPDGFMFMVRNSYAPVYRHRSFEFGQARMVDGKILQDVEIIDADGAAWDALYTLEPQSQDHRVHLEEGGNVLEPDLLKLNASTRHPSGGSRQRFCARLRRAMASLQG